MTDIIVKIFQVSIDVWIIFTSTELLGPSDLTSAVQEGEPGVLGPA